MKDCARHPSCHKTCSNINEFRFVVCPQNCIPNGCECPNGTVVDKEKNECVDISECPNMPPRNRSK